MPCDAILQDDDDQGDVFAVCWLPPGHAGDHEYYAGWKVRDAAGERQRLILHWSTKE